MALDCYQFKNYVVKPALSAIGLLSDSAVNLMLGTCAQESLFGSYLMQRGMEYNGGIGIYQMQSAAYHDTWDRLVATSKPLQAKIALFLGYQGKPSLQRLATDLALATIMTRLYYAKINIPLPMAQNGPKELAHYWKAWYNTPLGKGTEEEFIQNYQKYVIC